MRAKRSVEGGLKRKLKNGEYSIKLSATYTKEKAIEDVFTKKLEEGCKDWYPHYWFAFISMGRPIGDGNCSALFNGGLPTKVMTNGLGPSASIMYGEGARDARKLEHRKMMEALATTDSITTMSSTSRKRKGGSNSSSQSTPIVEGPNTKMHVIVQQKHSIQMYKDQIQVMLDLGCAQEDINEVRQNYLALLKSITNPTSSASTSTTVSHSVIATSAGEHDITGNVTCDLTNTFGTMV